MFAMPFGRILWKEYRTQRSLWLSLLLLGFLLEIVVVLYIGDSQQRSMSLNSIPVTFGIMYAIGCGAVLFAGEREDRTSEWLVCLSAPPHMTLAAKLAFALLSTIAVQLLLTITVLCLNASDRNNAFITMPTTWMSALFVLVWSILGSLTSRRVLVAIGVMVFWLAIAIVSTAVFLSGTGPSSPESQAHLFTIVMSIWCVGICAIAAWIGWHWCQGRYLDGMILEGFLSRYESRWNRLTFQSTVGKRLPVRNEVEYAWRRAWCRLVWQERHRDSVYVSIAIGSVAISVLLAMVGHVDSPLFKFLAWLLYLGIPTAMGVLAFESDPERQKSVFLINRGITPAAVWLAKQSVWMFRAFWITAVVVMVPFAASHLVAWVAAIPTNPPPRSIFGEVLHSPASAIWSILLSYSCGQLASLMFSRVVLAGVIAWVINGLLYQWQLNVHSLSVPRWWSMGFLVVAMLGITLWQTKLWMMLDDSFNRRWKLWSVIASVPILLLMAFAGFRVAEVAVLSNKVSAQLHVPTPPQKLTSDEVLVRDRISSLSRMNFSQDPATVDEIVTLMDRDLSTLNVQPRTQFAFDVMRMTKVVLARADDHMRDEQPAKALDCYLASLKLARLSAKGAPFNEMWRTACASQYETLEKAVEWMSHPLQTPTSIRKAITAFEAELQRYPSAAEAVAASYSADHHIVENPSIEQMNQYVVDGRHLVDRPVLELMASAWFPWERWRLDLLMKREAEYLWVEALALEGSLKTYSSNYQARSTLPPSPQVPLLLRPFLSESSIPVMARAFGSLLMMREYVLQRQTEIRAALTRMELIAFRLEHGKLPDRLMELMATIEGRYLIDPWSNRLFDYYPAFLVSAGNANSAIVPTSATTTGIQDTRPFQAMTISKVDFWNQMMFRTGNTMSSGQTIEIPFRELLNDSNSLSSFAEANFMTSSFERIEFIRRLYVIPKGIQPVEE